MKSKLLFEVTKE